MLGFLFRRSKKAEVIKMEPESVEATSLDQICGDDREVCKALGHTMFYDPRKVQATLDEAAKKAADYEKKGDDQHARMWYHIAGGLALWKGDAAKVKQYFGKCAKLAPDMDYEPITKVPKKAVAKAQEFYDKFLK
jgi:hypothetical protein